MPPPGGTRTSLTETVSLRYGSYEQKVRFGTGDIFSPGNPTPPVRQEPVRQYDFRPGENTFWTPRSGEGWSFAQLRNFVEPGGFDLVRLAIETRKDQVERIDFVIRSKDKKKRNDKADSGRIEKVSKLIRKPDGVRDFATWTRRLLEDLFVLDAPAVEIRRNRGGNIIALDVVDGSTFKILIDETGRTPLPPLPAYEQVIKGRPWALLTTDDLIYRPRNERPHRLYGFSPIEQIITTIHIGLSRQLSQLKYFTAGNVPPGFLNAPEGWTQENITDFNDWLNSILAGNLDTRRQMVMIPHGAKYQPIKESPVKDEFDEWLARIVCYAFSLPPTPFIKQLNRSTAESSDQSALEEGLEPIKGYLKRWWDDFIQNRLGMADLEFAWEDHHEPDPLIQSQVDDAMVRNATKTVNEIREAHGLDPVTNGNRLMIYTTQGAVLLDDIVSGEVVGDQVKDDGEIQDDKKDKKSGSDKEDGASASDTADKTPEKDDKKPADKSDTGDDT